MRAQPLMSFPSKSFFSTAHAGIAASARNATHFFIPILLSSHNDYLLQYAGVSRGVSAVFSGEMATNARKCPCTARWLPTADFSGDMTSSLKDRTRRSFQEYYGFKDCLWLAESLCATLRSP